MTQHEGVYAKTCWLGVSTIKIQLSVFVKSKAHIIIILWNTTKRVCQVKSRHHHHPMEYNSFSP